MNRHFVIFRCKISYFFTEKKKSLLCVRELEIINFLFAFISAVLDTINVIQSPFLKSAGVPILPKEKE